MNTTEHHSTNHRADLSRSGVPHYIQLATLFRSRIDSGQWTTGDQIPTIDELTVECGVARATIRQAIGLLEDEGLVSRFRAKGTFVTAKANDRIWCEMETDWNGMLSVRDGAVIQVLSDSFVPLPVLPRHPVGKIGSNFRYLRRRHLRNGQAYLIADVFIDGALAAKLPEDAFKTKTSLRLAASIPGIKIAEARQTLTVGTADIETANLLDVPLNAPVCFVDRSATDQRNRLVLVSKGIYRGDMVRMDVKLR